MKRQQEKHLEDNTSAKKKKPKKERVILLEVEEEEEQTPFKKTQRKLRKERESSHEEGEETSAKKKKKTFEGSSLKKHIKENSSSKKQKPNKEQGTPLEEEEAEEEQTPFKKKQKKLRKERESFSEEEEETSAKKKTKVFEGSSSKKQAKRHREVSLEGKLEVDKDEERKQKRKNNIEKEIHSEEDPQLENGVRAEGHVKTVDVSFRLLVPSKDVGKVIGKQGSRIRQLREESRRAHIKIGDSIMNLEERVIWVASKEDTLTSQSAAEKALLLVASLLIRPENEDQDSAKIRLLVAGSQAKIAIGKDGETLNDIRDNTGAIVSVFSKDRFPLLALASQTDKLLQLEGKAPQVQEALELVATRLRESLQQSGNVERSRGGTKHGAFETTVQIRIPDEYIGKLIGKEGSTIWQIKEQCRVHFKVDEDFEEGRKERIVHLKGMLSQVTMAQTLLQVVLASKQRIK